MQYKAAITVLAIIAAAALIDFAYSERGRDSYSQGQANLAADKTDLAITYFSRALRKNPTDFAARLGLGQAYQKKGWADEALKQYEQAVQNGTVGLQAAHYNLGLALLEKGQPEAAFTQFKKSIELDPRNQAAHFNAGLTAEKLGRRTEARQFYQAALRIDPNFAPARKRLN